MSQRVDPPRVLAVCGLGMGTSLILRLTCETVFRRLGVPARIEHADVCSARGADADVIVGQAMHMADLDGVAPIRIVVDDFIDDAALEARLRPQLEAGGWL